VLTVDASVLVAAALRDEPAHAASAEALRRITASGLGIHQPALALVEVTAAAAVYAATVLAAGCTLITLDVELVDRGGPIISVLTPADWIARQEGGAA
jgi:predicted nucleic acid-binding protein